ncbi:hypothetical protein POTOM_008221 [Populus tomentosa]|uniref:Uncharacterized protein n=1 Tax=Populus tomentosa TaxID=118781 RepID=A0A8X8AE31_POPTO|nr:hypothetical protein POTOM_008221 [Populus tomentosa]
MLPSIHLSNAWKSLARTKANVKSILMSTRNARKRRYVFLLIEKLGWNAIKAAPSFHEICCGDPTDYLIGNHACADPILFIELAL